MKQIFLFIFLSIFIHSFMFLELGFLIDNPSKKIHNSKVNSNNVSIKIRLSKEVSLLEKVVKSKRAVTKPKKQLKKAKIKSNDVLRSESVEKADSGQNDALSFYLDKVRKKILESRTKSRLAKRLKLKGRIELSFLIQRPGSIMNIQIQKSSGIKILDDSAISSLKNVEELPIVPSTIAMKEIPVSIEILYE